jgi:hypothetical protein
MATALVIFFLLLMAGCMIKIAYPDKQKTDLWDGPKPSPEEQRRNILFISCHLDEFPDPNSSLAKEYPELFKRSLALKAYKQLEKRREAGMITEQDYNTELEKILPLIDISEDVNL